MIETPHQNITLTLSDRENGSSQVSLSIAGIRIALRSADSSLPLELVGPMREFVAQERETEEREAADITIEVRWMTEDKGACEETRAARKLFDSGSTWQLYELKDGSREFRLAAPFSNWETYKLARFNRNWTRGLVLCRREFFEPGRSIYPLEYPLDEALVTNMLAMGRGVEIHACGLLDQDGRGYLFAGQSGAGKSTTARLWSNYEGVRILSDERVILRSREGHIWMHGTPWHGDSSLGGPLSAPLDCLFFLGRGESNEVLSVGRTEAAARLFACSFPPFYSAEALAFTLEFLEEVTGFVETHELRFVPDERVIETVRERAACASLRV